jgi:hypothetical protein
MSRPDGKMCLEVVGDRLACAWKILKSHWVMQCLKSIPTLPVHYA